MIEVSDLLQIAILTLISFALILGSFLFVKQITKDGEEPGSLLWLLCFFALAYLVWSLG